MLQRSGNASRYVDCLVAQYPPPAEMTLKHLSRMVKQRHPWVLSPVGGVRHDLPRFGGSTPEPMAGAYSWDADSVMDGEGELHDRRDWEL